MTNRERLIAAIKALSPRGEFTRTDLVLDASKDGANGTLKELCTEGVIRLCRKSRVKGGMANFYEVVDLNKRMIKPGEVVRKEQFSADAWRTVYPQLFIAHPAPVNARVIRHE